MQMQWFMELTCAASGGRNTWPNIRDYGIGGWSRKKVAGNGQCFSVFLCPLIQRASWIREQRPDGHLIEAACREERVDLELVTKAV